MPKRPHEALEILGLDPNKEYTVRVIRKQYRKMALQAHPDKGGNHETFCKINDAYKLLTDIDIDLIALKKERCNQAYISGGNLYILARHLAESVQLPFDMINVICSLAAKKDEEHAFLKGWNTRKKIKETHLEKTSDAQRSAGIKPEVIRPF